MITTGDKVTYALRPSCTAEEAAAMMLGWMRGERRAPFIQVTKDGISPDQFPFVTFLPGSLAEILEEQREAARLDFLNSLAEYPDFAAAPEKEALVEEWDALARRAQTYLLDIADEFAKGDSSALRVDREATEQTRVTHYTIRSVDLWAHQKYGISIIEPLPMSEGQLERPIQGGDKESAPNGGLSKTKADHLFTSFAFLVEALAKNALAYRREDGRPNVKAIAERIEQLGREANGGQPLSGQSAEAIKGRIEEATAIKNRKLPSR